METVEQLRDRGRVALPGGPHDRKDHGCGTQARGRRGLQLRGAPQDRPLELAQRRPGRLEERALRLAIRRERLGPAARPVQRQHQLLAKPLAQWVLLDERLQLGEQLDVEAEQEIGRDTVLERRDAQLLEADDLRLREREARELGQRGSAPQVEGFAQLRRREDGVAGDERASSLRRQALEPKHVDALRVHAQDVAGLPCRERVVREHLAQPGGVDMQRGRSRLGRRETPQPFDQLVGGDDAVRVQDQQREERPLLPAAKSHR
jgi:hypothetical protein